MRIEPWAEAERVVLVYQRRCAVVNVATCPEQRKRRLSPRLQSVTATGGGSLVFGVHEWKNAIFDGGILTAGYIVPEEKTLTLGYGASQAVECGPVDDVQILGFSVGICVLRVERTAGFVDANGGGAKDVRVNVVLDFLWECE